MKLWMPWLRARKRVARKASCQWAAPHLKINQDLDMPQATTTISNKLGLHARASAKLTKLAGSFPCEVWIAKGERRVNAKSIMGVMMLAAGIGSEVVIDTDGDQAQEALDAILALIADKFGEGE
jgi:phosphocarrier protein